MEDHPMLDSPPNAEQIMFARIKAEQEAAEQQRQLHEQREALAEANLKKEITRCLKEINVAAKAAVKRLDNATPDRFPGSQPKEIVVGYLSKRHARNLFMRSRVQQTETRATWKLCTFTRYSFVLASNGKVYYQSHEPYLDIRGRRWGGYHEIDEERLRSVHQYLPRLDTADQLLQSLNEICI